MSSVNKVILVGRLGKDPEVRHTNNSVPVANFSLATSETFKDSSGEKKEQTEWHNIVAWRHLAEISEKYLRKGKLIYVEGKLRTRSWDDKDGNKRYSTEVVADTIEMLGKREDDEGRSGGSEYGAQGGNRQESYSGSGDAGRPQEAKERSANVQVDDDDLPF